MSHEIKFIFFDMGKVLLNFDHQRLTRQVAELSGKTEPDIDQLLFHEPHDLENRFERGEFDADEFHKRFCQQAACEVPKSDLMEAVADIFWLNVPIVHLLTQLKIANFPMAVLSNTCVAHWEWALQKFTVLDKYFPQRILSYEEASMKPDAKIYQSAITLAKQLVGCETAEIFFTDDKQENIDAAREAGMQSELFVSTAALANQLIKGNVPIVV